jgi:hypothetical protein
MSFLCYDNNEIPYFLNVYKYKGTSITDKIKELEKKFKERKQNVQSLA